VTDNGKGADDTTLKKMFDAYYTTKHAGIGTGLGLHMAKAIIERNMHGLIRVKNVKGGGLCVSIILEGHCNG
jgi:signal transduction histidine kinase